MKNLIDFRRALLARNSVRIDYTAQGESESLQYARQGFFTDEATATRKLRQIYGGDDVCTVKFLDGDHNERQSVPAVRAVVLSLKDFQPNLELQQRLIHFIRRFPPVILKLAPLHRVGFEDYSLYTLLHHQMIMYGKCDLKAFIDEAKDEHERLRRLRVFLACFCLGLIAPLKGASNGHSSHAKNISVLQRIVNRVRGL